MLIPIGRRKILEVFIKNLFKEIHLREIARLSKVSLTNANSSLKLFVKDDMFKRRNVSNMAFFKPNLESEDILKIFEFLELEKRKGFYNKNKKIARLLQKYTQDIIDLSKRRITGSGLEDTTIARPYRFQGENCFYHITSRGDSRKKIFISA